MMPKKGVVTPQFILSVWNKLSIDPIRPARMTALRSQHLRQRIKANPDHDFWVKAIEHVMNSIFCRGLKGWVITFDAFARRQDMAVKAFEGVYDYRAGSAPTLEARAQRLMSARGSRYCDHDPTCGSASVCRMERVHELFEDGMREPRREAFRNRRT